MLISSHTAAADSPDDLETAEEAGPFVLNLCTVAGPIAIPQPRSELLSRFTFFCSRSQSGDRQTWWLRLGYFTTRDDAEKWLQRLVRVYPGATIAEADIVADLSAPAPLLRSFP